MAKNTTGAPRDTALRYICMLSHIPMEPLSVTTQELKRRLALEDYIVDTRTIQRDLERLSTKFPLDNAPGQRRELRWFFRKGTASQWPAMSTDTALTLLLTEQNLKPLVPYQTLSTLDSLVNQARHVLTVQDRSGGRKSWAESVRIAPKGFALQPAKIEPQVMTDLFEAIRRQRQLKITNRQERESIVNPLGIIMRGSVLYLVCTYHNHNSLRTTALHRIQSTKIETTDLISPQNFNLDDALRDGLLNWRLDPGKKKLFEIETSNHIANYLEENRITANQVVKPLSENRTLIKFESEDTNELRQWLLGFGAEIKVRKPSDVKKWLSETARNLINLYSD